MQNNPIRALLLFILETQGQNAVINLVEDAGLEIALYKSFFESLQKELTS